MIAFVKGTVAGLTLSSAVVEVGGVGLEVICTPSTLATLHVGDQATLPTSMVVREESLTLFGFLDDDEKSVFEMLQTASGVGPKLAQAMLAVHSPDGLRRAITTEDVKTLTTVPGIGQKGAQRIILELKDRIGAPDHHGRPGAPQPVAKAEDAWRGQVHTGLVGLGWSAKEADRAVDTRRRPGRSRARRRRAAARGPPRAEQGLSRCTTTPTPTAPPPGRGRAERRRARLRREPGSGRRRGRGRRAGRRGGAASPHPRRGHRPGARARAALPGARGGPRS